MLKKGFILFVLIGLLVGLSPSVFAGSKTWSKVGKGLAIYEGAKILTGRQGNLAQDVGGLMHPSRQPQQTHQEQGGGSYSDGYNAGYRSGYEAGYNAGFRAGTQQK